MQKERPIAEGNADSSFEQPDAACATDGAGKSPGDRPDAASPSRCYGVQVLVAGGRESWRDHVSMQMRQAGFNATAVDCAADALRVLVLGLPVDVLVTDSDLRGDLRCGRLAAEARALRPNLRIVLARDQGEDAALPEQVPDAVIVPAADLDTRFATTVREAIVTRV